MKYNDFEELKKELLFKKIVKWEADKLTLDNGDILEICCAEQECCAYAGGEFKNVVLDAAITNIELGKIRENKEEDNYDYEENYVTVTIFHNLNPIALADCSANSGNGGYYYSVAAFELNNIFYKIVEA